MDARKNFAYGTVLTAPSPPTSGTTLVLGSGIGARFPDPATDGAFNLVVWPAGVSPLASNAEIVRCSARSVDTCTIARTQEGTSARNIIAGDQVALAATDKWWDDIEQAAKGALLVAPSDASAALKAQAAYVCDGVDDDVEITAALASLPFEGGEVRILQGNYYMGTSSTSFVDGWNTKGGISLKGPSRRQGAIFHVPAGSAAPCAVRMSATQGGSQRVEGIHVRFDNAIGLASDGIQMQSAEGQIIGCTVVNAGRHGFVLDGEPASHGAAPSLLGTSGCIRNCEAQGCGQGGLAAGSTVEAGDGFLVTVLHENAVISDCFVNGGNGDAGACLAANLVSGNVYTSLTVTPLTNAISSGDLLVIGTTATVPQTRQIVRCNANASAGATSLSVDSFTANFNYSTSGNLTYVCNYTHMQTRNGFNIINTIAHLFNCHPYFCYESGLRAYQSSVDIVGGEYETNGWCDLDIQGSLTPTLVHSTIVGVHTYGVKAFASLHCFGCLLMNVHACYFDGNNCNSTIYMQSCNSCTIVGNSLLNGGTPFGGNGWSMNVQNCDSTIIAHNAIFANNTPGGSRKGIQVFNSPNMNVESNNISLSSGTPIVQSSNTNSIFKNNRGYNPIGVETVAVPASTVAVAAVAYDRTYYITAGAGSTTVAISGGPTITLTASSLNTVRVPAGCTMTPTYANAPTWVVEGE